MLQLKLESGFSPFHLSGLKSIEDGTLEDGTHCLRLQGQDYASRTQTVWLGKKDLLIRRIEIVEDGKSRQVITVNPKANIEIADENLVFRQPLAK